MSKVGVLAFLLALGALAISGYGVSLLHKQRADLTQLRQEVADFPPRLEKFKGAVREMGRELTSVVMEEIDLTRPGWQSIGKGFYIIDVSGAADAQGMLLRGKVINTTTVTHEGLVFRARVDNVAAPFSIAKAPPGVALPFELRIPGVPPGAAAPNSGSKKGFVTLESSTISFASSTAKTPAPREPFDPDKTLR